MQRFFLTYEIDNSGEYIVPERLQPIQPEYKWEEEDNLFMRYEYDLFMPKGIMSQLTVQMHHYIDNHDLVWRRGVVLEREQAMAEIVESYDARTIKIRIAGKNRRDFMTIISEQLDQINAQYEKIKVEKMIPCNCPECKTNSEPNFYKYKDLKRRLERGRWEVECGKSYVMVNVSSLIDEVINKKIHGAYRTDMILKTMVRPPQKIKRDKVFVSYSRKDNEWLERVKTHLKVLETIGITINVWTDIDVKPGMEWQKELEKGLSSAKVAILLVSTDFLASDFISANELPPLLKAAKNDGATILPLILKPCLFSMHKKISQYQSVNDPKKPLSKLTESEQDDELVKLTERVVELMN